MKPIRSYSNISAVGNKRVDEILDGEVIVQEKIDGSQISFGVIDGELQIRSKNAMRDIERELREGSMFDKGIRAIKKREDLLKPGYVYRGEYLRKPKHNTKAYDRVPNYHIILYDVDIGNQHYCTPDGLEIEADLLDFETVPVYYQGDECTVEMLEGFLENKTSILGDHVKIEGVVVKNYNKFTRDDKIMMAKIVSTEFKERHQKSWKKRNPGPIERVVNNLNKRAIWRKAIQHLRDEGKLEHRLRDIGKLHDEIRRDLYDEQGQLIKDTLFDHYKDKVFKQMFGGFPEFYKAQLRNRVRE